MSDSGCGIPPQSGALPGAGEIPGYQHRGGPWDGQQAEQRGGDEGHLHQTHPGGQSRRTQRHPEDWRQDRRGEETPFCDEYFIKGAREWKTTFFFHFGFVE